MQHRRRVSTNSDDSEMATPPHLQGAADGLDSLRRKLQRTHLEEYGINSIELWKRALHMLVHIRRGMPMSDVASTSPLLSQHPSEPASPDQSAIQLPRTPSPNDHVSPTHGTYASKLVVDTADVAGPIVSIVGASLTPVKPRVFRHPRARHENFSFHSDSSSPSSKTNGGARAKVVEAAIHMTNQDDEKIAGLPLRAWIEILRELYDPDEMLSEKQVEFIIRYGRDRGTLAAESEWLGEPESVQVWRVLEAMRCLSYDD